MIHRKASTNAAVRVSSLVVLTLFLAGCGSTGSNGGGQLFQSGLLSPGESFSYTFEEEGNFPYFCETHGADMTGEVNVSAGAQISGEDTVEMRNLAYNPAQVSITPGTEIVWINREDPGVDAHTVTSGTPSTGNGGGY